MAEQDLDRGDDFVPTDDAAEQPVVKDAPADKADGKGADDATKSKDGDDAGADKGDGKDADDGEGDAKKVDKKFEKKSDGKAIPKARVDQMVANERAARIAAENRAAELEKNIAAVSKVEDTKKLEDEITALEKQHSKAMLDGNADAAAELAGKIRLKERQIQIELNKGMSTQAKEEAREDIRLDLIIERLEDQYPALNENSEEYDQDLVDMVLATQRQLVEVQKMSLSNALQAATKKVMDKFKPAVAAKEEDDDEADKTGLDKAKVADRTKSQVDKNIDTVKKQPPDTKGAGVDSDKKGITGNVDVTKLSQSEFNALPETTKERLRGDTL